MTGMEQQTICDGVNFRSIKDTKFKTARISVHFMLPLKKDKAAANAILPFLLSRTSREYPDFTKLGQRLAELYGADLSADVQKLGDIQVLSVSASSLADRYALENEHITEELSGLLCSILFDPLLENGSFPEDGFKQEQRQTIELIESEYNDKRVYAKQRCEQIMCENEPFGISRFGSKEAIASLKREALTETWKELIQTARIEIMALGDCDTERAYHRFAESFQKANRGSTVACDTMHQERAMQVKDVTESMDVAQAKLVMGFRTGTAVPDAEVPVVRLMAALYGGTPNSKLFLNVREKLSLCYYCNAQYNGMKGIMLVQSGVENQNMERAKEEILAQLEAVKRGDFDENDVQAAKMSMGNSYRTVSDSLGGLESWYLSQTFSEKNQTPEEAAEEIDAVTREQIIEAAKRVTLDTVYRLTGSGEDAE